MKKYLYQLFSFFFHAVFSIAAFAQIPPGYYDQANGLSGQPLQTALHNIIDDHDAVSYSSLISYFQSTDKKPDNSVWDMYSDIPGGTPPYVYYYNAGDECGNYSQEGDCFNREHSFPKSWFGGEVMPMYSDLFHVYPTDGYVNNKRDNYPYAKINSPQWTSSNGCKLGNSSTPGYSGVAFEPVNAYKGDFARTYFYMSVRYYTEDGGWPGSDMTTGSQLKPWALTMMLQWTEQDPVSQKEIDRNNAVYQIQANRNPFIDHPEYASMIWGNGTGIETPSQQYSLIIYPNPAEDYCHLVLTSHFDDPFLVIVYNITGKTMDCPVTLNNGLIRLDLSAVTQGVYLVAAKNLNSGMIFNGLILKQ